MKKNDIYTIEITGLADDAGIGRVEGFVVFCADTLPGELADVQIIKVTSSYAIGRALRILRMSEARILPQCQAFRKCGGCAFSHVKYESQLAFKQQHTLDCLTRIGGLSNFELLPIIGMDNPYNYRNKAQYPFAVDPKGNAVCGFYRKHSHEVVPLDLCMLEDERAASVRKAVLEHVNRLKLSVYDETKRRGLIRSITVRTSRISDEVMLILTANASSLPHSEDFITSITKSCPFVSSIYLNINCKATNVLLGDEFVHLYGKTYLRDSIGGVLFDVSPMSFYQVNPLQTERLYETVFSFAALSGGENIWDVYCGIGTIGIFMSARAAASSIELASLCGIEYVPQAIEDARRNAKLNGIQNASFFAGDAAKILSDPLPRSPLGGALPLPDVVILDPPRKGCSAELLDSILSAAPAKIIYVSCNPATLARDLKRLTMQYSCEKVQAADMFPWTGHVECVVLMSKVTK